MSVPICSKNNSGYGGVGDTNEANQEFDALLDYLSHRRGCHLAGYKRSTLMRRFAHRMREVKVDTYQDYRHYLQQHYEEYSALLETIFINVTNFFRDRDSWDYLAQEIIPKLIANLEVDAPLRVWSAACASGQEVYSLIILFAEALGIEACLQRVKVFATDVDEAALEQARQGIYHPKEVTEIPPNLLEKYFTQTEQGYLFHPQLRHTVIFGCHNLAEDAPLSQINLLLCRNALMYFNTEVQRAILIRFHFGLQNNGFLFLGRAESLNGQRQIFTPVNLKHRVYAKGLTLGVDEHLQISPRICKPQRVDFFTPHTHVWQTAFETSPFAQLVVDSNSCLMMANEQANILFDLTVKDVGRPLQKLKLGQLFGLCTSLKQVNHDRRPVALKNVEWKILTEPAYFNVYIVPVFCSDGHLFAMTLTFKDVTAHRQLEKKLEQVTLDLTRVSKTLKETKITLNYTSVELQCTQQELETVYQQMQFIEQN